MSESEAAHIAYLHKLYNCKDGDGNGSGDFILKSNEGKEFLVHSLLLTCRHMIKKILNEYK